MRWPRSKERSLRSPAPGTFQCETRPARSGRLCRNQSIRCDPHRSRGHHQRQRRSHSARLRTGGDGRSRQNGRQLGKAGRERALDGRRVGQADGGARLPRAQRVWWDDPCAGAFPGLNLERLETVFPRRPAAGRLRRHVHRCPEPGYCPQPRCGALHRDAGRTAPGRHGGTSHARSSDGPTHRAVLRQCRRGARPLAAERRHSDQSGAATRMSPL